MVIVIYVSGVERIFPTRVFGFMRRRSACVMPACVSLLLLHHLLTCAAAGHAPPLRRSSALNTTQAAIIRTMAPEWFPAKGLAKTWRKSLLGHLIGRCKPKLSECQSRDVYEFGVFTGRALKAMARTLLEDTAVDRFNGLHQSIARKFWGFDSSSWVSGRVVIVARS